MIIISILVHEGSYSLIFWKRRLEGTWYVQIVFGKDIFLSPFFWMSLLLFSLPQLFIQDEKNYEVIKSQANKVATLERWSRFSTTDSQAGEQTNKL